MKLNEETERPRRRQEAVQADLESPRKNNFHPLRCYSVV